MKAIVRIHKLKKLLRLTFPYKKSIRLVSLNIFLTNRKATIKFTNERINLKTIKVTEGMKKR